MQPPYYTPQLEFCGKVQVATLNCESWDRFFFVSSDWRIRPLRVRQKTHEGFSGYIRRQNNMQALQEKVAELERRVEDLSEENCDLRDICDQNNAPAKPDFGLNRLCHDSAEMVLKIAHNKPAAGGQRVPPALVRHKTQGREPIAMLVGIKCAQPL